MLSMDGKIVFVTIPIRYDQAIRWYTEKGTVKVDTRLSPEEFWKYRREAMENGME